MSGIPDPRLVDRLAAFPTLAAIPRPELEWLAAHGRLERRDAGAVVAPKGQPIETLWIILSGHVVVRVDRGAGPRTVIEWRAGEVSGMLPYSRMTGPPGDNYVTDDTELLMISTEHFPEMVHRCPAFTTYTVHLMLDRARMFNASDMQDEKMISLGRLSAGLAHELNNPASAVVRAAKLLRSSLVESEAAARAVGAAGLGDDEVAAVERARAVAVAQAEERNVSPMELADREGRITDWLDRHHADDAHAAPLAEAGVGIDTLDALAATVRPDALDAVLRHVAASAAVGLLAGDIERAGTRIDGLVGAVKRFSYMDRLTGPEVVDVEAGLHDTIRMLTAKAREKGATISLHLDAGLPPVNATGGDLNQVWMNLLDNALDAIDVSGHIEVTGSVELDQVVIHVVDDGPGIPEDVMPKIFDAFFTTKPPGQGTGLGLDIARRLVRGNRGEITVTSRPGKTAFRVSLPAVSPDPPSGP